MTTPSNVLAHPLPILATGLLVIYSHRRSKLTPLGVLTALITAVIHISFPSPLPFWSLVLFFLQGTIATRFGKKNKHSLTTSSTGGSGGEGPRNAVQVLANSGAADLFILLAFADVLSTQAALVGILASYAAASADTLSSELGILSTAAPVLVTAPWRRVPKGTNGGVSLLGLVAGIGGAAGIAGLDFLFEGNVGRTTTIVALGTAGTLLDSLLGALVQATVEDKKTGKVVEGENGKRVLVTKDGSRVMRGLDLLNNNGVNFAMAFIIGLAGVINEEFQSW